MFQEQCLWSLTFFKQLKDWRKQYFGEKKISAEKTQNSKIFVNKIVFF
jgi:hypothetical protein